MIGIGGFVSLYYGIKFLRPPADINPAVGRDESDDIVVPVKHHAQRLSEPPIFSTPFLNFQRKTYSTMHLCTNYQPQQPSFEKLKCPDDDDLLLPLYLSKRRVAPRRSPTGEHMNVCSNQSHPKRAGKIELIQEDNSRGYRSIDRSSSIASSCDRSIEIAEQDVPLTTT